MAGWLSSSRSFIPCAPDDAGMKLLVKLLAHRQMFGLAVGVPRRNFVGDYNQVTTENNCNMSRLPVATRTITWLQPHKKDVHMSHNCN